MYTKANKHTLKISFFCIIFFQFMTFPIFAADMSLPNIVRFYEKKMFDSSNTRQTEPSKVVRIGHLENYVVLKTPPVEGYPGYGFEYIEELFKYSKEKYTVTYVKVDWNDAFNMLESGEIDMLAGVSYTTDRARKFLYLENEMGKDTILLLSLRELKKNNTYETIDGSRICALEGSIPLGRLYSYIEKNNLDVYVEEKVFGSIQEIKNLDFDYVFHSSMQMEQGFPSVASFGYDPVYLIANKENQELVDNLNAAAEVMTTHDYLIKERLYLKYFDNKGSKETLSYEEYAQLQDGEVYNVAVPSFNSPLAFSQNGKLSGLFVDIINMVKNIAGIDINIIQIDKNTPDSVLNTIDFSLLPKKVQLLLDLPTSNPLVLLPYILVEKNSEKEEEVLGTLSYYGLSEEDISFFIKNQKIVEYSTALDLINAFNAGKVDNMFFTVGSFAAFSSNITVDSYTVESINYSYMPTVTYSPNFPAEKVELFNKIFTHLSASSIENSLFKNITLVGVKDEFYYIREYRFQIIISGIILLIIFLFFLYRVKRVKDQELEKLTNFDKVTGLFTYSYFLTAVKKAIADERKDFCIVSFDIDNFRYINEIYGFKVGTDILKHIAYHIKLNLITPLPVARHVGDNFLLLLERQHLFDTQQPAFKPDALSKELNRFVGENYNISFSLGVYEILDRTLDINYMLDCANIARSKSKLLFGTNFEIFTEDMKKIYTEQNNILAHVQSAFIEKEFVMYYQAKFDISTMQIVGAESLIRWFKNEKMIPPDLFIPIIEEHGAIEQLDAYVIDAVCDFMKRNIDLDIPKIAINMSGLTIIKENVETMISEIMNNYSIKPEQIDIEITETALVENIDIIINKINKLRSAGISISMDDFGAGVSSLNRLRNIPIDTLKIDRGFIVDSFDDSTGVAIIKNIINLSKDIGVETVAEGIETLEQLNFLKEIGCDFGQGYFFARPMPEADFLELLKKNREEYN